MQHERRRYPRVKRSIRLTLQKKRLLFMRGPKSSAEIVDVSRSGARVNTLADLAQGERVSLVLKTKSIRPTLTFSGVVVWTRNVSTAQGRFLQAGVKFEAVPAEQAGLLFRMAVGQIEE